jgi:hypothetical protein
MKKFAFLITILPLVLFCSCGKDEDALLVASDFVTYFDESPVDNMIIGIVSAGTSKGTINYSLTSTTPSGAFTIDENTGMLKVDDPLLFDYETNPVITGVAKLESDGVEKSVDITIYLNDVYTHYAGIRDITAMTGTIGLTQNYLMGTKHTLLVGGTLKSINLFGRNTGTNVQMALYKDNNGAPGALLATSVTGVVNVTGEISLAVNPVKIPEGDYWIMAVFSETGSHANRGTVSNTLFYFGAITYGSEFPSSATDFGSSTYTPVAYSITVE